MFFGIYDLPICICKPGRRRRLAACLRPGGAAEVWRPPDGVRM